MNKQVRHARWPQVRIHPPGCRAGRTGICSASSVQICRTLEGVGMRDGVLVGVRVWACLMRTMHSRGFGAGADDAAT